MAAIVRRYNYEMGFAVNGEPIPDPSVFTGKGSALDSMGNRDATGTLHRAMVAYKHPVKLEYHNITFAMMQEIMSKMTDESFQFTFPDPMDGLITVKAYVGDRDWDTVEARDSVGSGDDVGWKGAWLGNLSFSVIEY